MGAPFHTRRLRSEGLTFPLVRFWPNFICELCTVRAVTGRELTRPSDRRLLQLERMRLIDLAHAWAKSTHSGYQAKLRSLSNFQQNFGVPILRPTHLLAPPHGPDIPLMWSQEYHSLSPGRSGPMTFGTLRQSRSAVAYFYAIDALQSAPLRSHVDQSHRLIFGPVRCTDGISSTMFATGLSSRLGTASRPTVALKYRHVFQLDSQLHQSFARASTPVARHFYALAGLANSLLWLGWLRSGELFQLTWRDIHAVLPADGPTMDLPPSVGALLLRLTPETKSSRSRTVDVVISYVTAGGFTPGKWLQRARATAPPSRPSDLIFSTPNGNPWTSIFFRTTFLHPSLMEQRSTDAFLRAFNNESGNTIPDKFWSLHSYRRGARTHVSRRHRSQMRTATTDEIYEHARWRRRSSSEQIDVHYREWTLRDRISLTQLCM